MPSPRNRTKLIDLGGLSAPLRPRGQLKAKQPLITYSFRLDQRSSLQTSLKKIAKGANLDLEVWSATGRLGKSKKPKNRSEQLSFGALEPGTYAVKIRRKQGQSKYQLSLVANALDSSAPGTNPGTGNPNNPPPVPRAPSDIFQMGGAPDGRSTYFSIDFSKLDDDPRADFGLFRGAILSAAVSAGGDPVAWGNLPGLRTDDPNPKVFSANSSITPFSGIKALDYQPGDLISFKNALGKTEFRAILLSDDGYPLCIGLIATSNDSNLPNSLSLLKSTLAIEGKVTAVRFDLTQHGTDFRSKGLQLETVSLFPYINFAFRSDYLMRPDEQNYTLTQNLSPDGSSVEFSSSPRNFGVVGNQLSNTITGNSGENRLNGYGTSLSDISQFDILIGGAGRDRFVLGEGSNPYYVESGDGYAIIQDWEPGFDSLQTAFVTGGSYTVRHVAVANMGDSRLDTEIYYNNGSIRDRIAILQDIVDSPFPVEP